MVKLEFKKFGMSKLYCICPSKDDLLATCLNPDAYKNVGFSASPPLL